MDRVFDQDMAHAFGCGMLDAQKIIGMIDAINAHRFTEVPDNVPTAREVRSTMDAYRLGYWSETARAANALLVSDS